VVAWEKDRDEIMNANPSQIRILVVDDHPLLRQGIARLVADQHDISLIAEASNGREAIVQFRAHRPDVTLMDLQMPEMNGLDAIVAIRDEFPEARIIMLTTYDGDVQVLRALKAGARAYLLKNLLRKELLETIRAVHAGRKTLSPEVSYQLAEHATDDALTPAEIDVLASDCRWQCQQTDCRPALDHPKKPSKAESRTSSRN
jgi:DNA-binding NarL/FixJ family response regulator